MPRREQLTAAAVPGIHRALIQSYLAESEEIDPRLRFMDIDPAELASVNRKQPHSRQMRRTAEGLESGELIAVAACRVRRLLTVDRVPPWLAGDPCVGVIVGTDDTIRPAGPDDVVHL